MPSHRFWTDERLDEYIALLKESATVGEALNSFRARHKRRISSSGATQSVRAYCGKFPAELVMRSEAAVAERDEQALLRRRVREQQKTIRRLERETETSALVKSLLGRVVDAPQNPPKWLQRANKRKIEHGTPTLFLSDLHHGEVVSAAEMSGCNEFSPEISRKRIRTVFDRSLYLLDSVFANPVYPGIVLACGGDMLSGNIHEEIRESNGMPIFDALLDLADVLTAGIRLLAERFGSVYVPWVVGNHGRIDRKPRAKHGPADNYEYMLGHHLAARFDGDKRVTIQVSDAFSLRYTVHSTRYLLMHGDSFKGGGGISGPLLPWTLGDHRLRKQRASMSSWTGRDQSYDVLLFGHWHTYFPSRTFVANGSLKGFDEYAAKCGFSYEPPQQALWLTSPDLGPTIHLPVYGEDPPRPGRRA